MIRHLYIYALLLCTSFSLLSNAQDKEQWITILIHGSIGVEAHLTYDLCVKLLKDDILYSPYHMNIENRRTHRNFYKNQAVGPKGLRKISKGKKYSGANRFAQISRRLCHEIEPERESSYYTFGWTGILSHSMRYRESYVLYKELKEELELLRKKNIVPKIRIIGYSHGGNIALNLPQIKRESFSDDTLEIDELILLGVPLQKINAYEAYEPFFKKIYNIYSKADYVQCIDIFSPFDFFSNRAFSNLKNTPNQTHIYDIELRVQQLHNKELGTSELKNKINVSNLKKMSPGHFEFWFFGWGTRHYRKDFCLYPLPIALLVPSIIQCINTHGNEYNHIALTLVPEYGKALISNNFKKLKEIDFINSDLLAECRRRASYAIR